MLSDQERREMKDDAASASLRQEFEMLRACSRFPAGQPIDVDHVVDFLTTMNQLVSPAAAPPARPFVEYTRVLL